MVEHLTLHDPSHDADPDPCGDCGRDHLNGEHIALTVPRSDEPSRTRRAWEGCVDCWVKRSSPARHEALAATVERVRALADDWEQRANGARVTGKVGDVRKDNLTALDAEEVRDG